MNETTKEIVKSTAPLLKQNGEAITKAMYVILFEKYPETQKLFENSTPDQHKKLANAIYAYAANIDKLDALKGGIETIVATHIKANVKPEHYPMVEDALLTAIVNVLGEDVATSTVIDAWREAYRFLADVLISKEAEAYAK